MVSAAIWNLLSRLCSLIPSTFDPSVLCCRTKFYQQAIIAPTSVSTRMHDVLLLNRDLPAVPQLYIQLMNAEDKCSIMPDYKYPTLMELLHRG